jgi:hypothetical protein
MFYKVDEGILLFGKVVTSPTFELTIPTKDKFEYPQDGWYWFDTREDACAFFNWPLEDM